MKLTPPRYVPVLAIAALCLLLGSTGGAVAGSLITGKQIRDNTVSTKDIKNKTIASKDLAPKTIKSLKGKKGASAWDTIPSGKTVTGYFYDTGVSAATPGERVENISFPAQAPANPTGYGFGADSSAETVDDPACTGTFDAPTAPAGHVCVYVDGMNGFSSAGVYSWDALSAAKHTFYLSFDETAADTSYFYFGVWAYTAP